MAEKLLSAKAVEKAKPAEAVRYLNDGNGLRLRIGGINPLFVGSQRAVSPDRPGHLAASARPSACRSASGP